MGTQERNHNMACGRGQGLMVVLFGVVVVGGVMMLAAGPQMHAPWQGDTMDEADRSGSESLTVGSSGHPPDRPAGGIYRVVGDQRNRSWDLERSGYVPYPKAKFIVVSGASGNHFSPLLCLVRSVRYYHPDPAEVPLIFYDLGLDPGQRELIEAENAHVEIRTFNYSKYPSYYDIRVNAGEYAWKPEILMEVVAESLTNVLWLDAGCTIHKSLHGLGKFMDGAGFYSWLISYKSAKSWYMHAGMSKFLEAAPKGGIFRQNSGPFRWQDHRADSGSSASGGIVGFNPTSEWVGKIGVPWRECARIKACIAPEGSSRANHRQDQSALTMLLHWKYEAFVHQMKVPKKFVRAHQDGLACRWGRGEWAQPLAARAAVGDATGSPAQWR